MGITLSQSLNNTNRQMNNLSSLLSKKNTPSSELSKTQLDCVTKNDLKIITCNAKVNQNEINLSKISNAQEKIQQHREWLLKVKEDMETAISADPTVLTVNNRPGATAFATYNRGGNLSAQVNARGVADGLDQADAVMPGIDVGDAYAAHGTGTDVACDTAARFIAMKNYIETKITSCDTQMEKLNNKHKALEKENDNYLKNASIAEEANENIKSLKADALKGELMKNRGLAMMIQNLMSANAKVKLDDIRSTAQDLKNM